MSSIRAGNPRKIHSNKKSLYNLVLGVVIINAAPFVYFFTSYPKDMVLQYGVSDITVTKDGATDKDVKDNAMKPPLLPMKPISRKLLLFLNFPSYYRLEENQGPSGLTSCDAKNSQGMLVGCELTVNKERFNESDAVLFNSHGKKEMKQFDFKPIKRPGTTWTFFAVESPKFSENELFGSVEFHDKFNSTMTYRGDSEFWHGYVQTKKRDFPLKPEVREAEEAKLRRAFRKKTKMAAIFVSHCGAPSRRDDYVKQLRQYIDVDVYGRCGLLKCENRILCNAIVSNNYKFYLAFENSLCKDYVTEKLLNAIQSRRIVPVVRGGADYAKLFPLNSMVDTSQFASPRELSYRLIELAANEDKWVGMFQWFWYYEIKDNALPLCQYCHHLFENRSPTHLYHDVWSWWNNDMCYPARDLEKSRPRYETSA